MRREHVDGERKSKSSKKIDIDPNLKELISELEEGLEIDQNDLDQCLVEQPSLYYEVSKQLAQYVSRRDAAKQHLQTVEARAQRGVRRSAAENDEKVTNQEVDSRVKAHKDVLEASDILLELNYSVSLLGALKDAFEQRSKALKDLSGLFIASYYTSSSVGGASSKLKDRQASDNRSAMAEERKKRYS